MDVLNIFLSFSLFVDSNLQTFTLKWKQGQMLFGKSVQS